MGALLKLSRGIDAVLRNIAFTFGWLFFAMAFVIVFDVVSRNGIVINLPFTDATLRLLPAFQLNLFGVDLGSTRLQELEWHLHAILFLTWIGYAYVRNAHVRIDILTASRSARTQAWLELIGCAVFALPYVLVALPYAHDFLVSSYRQNEGSNASTGLPWRWVLKGFLYFGFWSILLAVISVAARRIVFLFGSPELADEAMPDAAKSGH